MREEMEVEGRRVSIEVREDGVGDEAQVVDVGRGDVIVAMGWGEVRRR